MKECIWAYRVGAFGPGGGWDRVVSLPPQANLRHLLDQLRVQGLQGQVRSLAIVAHGDRPGVVRTDPEINTVSIWREPAVCGPLTMLRDFLSPTAQVMFVSCIAGASNEGSQMLSALSTFWDGRTVIGFNTSGEFNPYYTTAGDIFDTGGAFVGGTVLSGLSRAELISRRMTPASSSAKWARNGAIVRTPLNGLL